MHLSCFCSIGENGGVGELGEVGGARSIGGGVGGVVGEPQNLLGVGGSIKSSENLLWVWGFIKSSGALYDAGKSQKAMHGLCVKLHMPPIGNSNATFYRPLQKKIKKNKKNKKK